MSQGPRTSAKICLQIIEKRLILQIISLQNRFTGGGGPDTMSDKLIAIEEQDGPYKAVFQRIMRMVPDRDKNEKNLQRLLAFRLRIDGEAALNEYLIRKIRDSIKCAYTGNLYDFLKDDLIQKECGTDEEESDPEPPGAA
jgi:hypothetical protein